MNKKWHEDEAAKGKVTEKFLVERGWGFGSVRGYDVVKTCTTLEAALNEVSEREKYCERKHQSYRVVKVVREVIKLDRKFNREEEF